MKHQTHHDAVALRKLNCTADEWDAWLMEVITDDAILFTGGKPRLKKTGKNKGKRTWDKPYRKVVVTDGEVRAEFERYEKETGLCGQCYGEKQECVGWSAKDGNKMITCRRCKGTGFALEGSQ